MERPSVQAPDTFYPGAVSHNTAAVKKPQGCNLSRILHFSCGERPSSGPAIRPAPAPQRKSGKKYGRTPHFPLYLRYRSFSRISLSRFQLTASAAPLHHGRKNRSSRKRKGMLPYSPG